MNYDINDKDFSIWFSQNIKPIMSNLSKQAKKGKCYICGKDCSSYCNSHSIPQFVLDNLSKNGQYSTFAATSGINFLKSTIGKNKAGTFHLICRECDSVFFSEYENKDVYLNFQKALPPLFFSKINIKNLLYLIGKMNEELSLLTALIQIGKTENSIYKKNIEVQYRIACEKLKRYEQLYQYTKCYIDKNIETEKMIYSKELPYIVPVAIQLAIPLAKGINGEIINNFSDIKAPFHMLNLCVFPLKNKSVILMSSHKAGTEYDTFETALNNLSLEKQLEVINYMVFLFSEDYYCNIDVLTKICGDEKFTEVCQCESECDLTLKKIPVIPNILTKQYALN